MKFETIEELIDYYHYDKNTVKVIEKGEEKEIEINELKTNRIFSHSFNNLTLVITQY